MWFGNIIRLLNRTISALYTTCQGREGNPRSLLILIQLQDQAQVEYLLHKKLTHTLLINYYTMFKHKNCFKSNQFENYNGNNLLLSYVSFFHLITNATNLRLDESLTDYPYDVPEPCSYCQKPIESRLKMYWHLKRVHLLNKKPCKFCALIRAYCLM